MYIQFDAQSSSSMNESAKTLVIVGVLFFVPFISLLVGRLQSLAVDFVGSAVSLTFTFFDASIRLVQEQSALHVQAAHLATMLYVYVYVFLVTMFLGALCIFCQRQYVMRSPTDGPLRLGSEALYWVTVLISIVLLLFTFSLNVGYQQIALHDPTQETLFEFFSSLLNLRDQLISFLITVPLILMVCAIFKYSLHERQNARSKNDR